MRIEKEYDLEGHSSDNLREDSSKVMFNFEKATFDI
jgi:hypothetical protein